MAYVKRLLPLLLLLLGAVMATAQDVYVSWEARLEPKDARAGESAQIILTAKIKKGWHIYSIGQENAGRPVAFEIKENEVVEANGDPVQPQPIKKFDPNFGVEVGMHEGAVAFALPVKLKEGATGIQKLTVAASSQACDPTQCVLPETVDVPVSFTVAAGEVRPDRTAAITAVPVQPEGHVAAKPGETGSAAPAGGSAPPQDETTATIEKAKDQGLVSYMWLAFLLGLSTLLTPCVFPMIPVTVSYFSKRGEADKPGKKNYSGALAYCAGIMGTFTGLGLAVTALFGATGISKFATNPWINLGLAALFVFLAANLFGVFELTMPSWLVNKANKASREKQGLMGPVLMGFTFTLTSFTCTVPFVGTLLASAANGEFFYPALGMLAFSTAFAIPFFLLALFPQALAKMPKSGSWLSTVKAFMGFLEIAAALKFLSNAELVWQLGWLTQDVFLAVWAAIAVVAGLYLIGWLRLGTETGAIKIGWPRRTFGFLMVGAAIICLAGIRGVSLGELGAFVPPEPYPGQKGTTADALNWSEDYEAGLEKAKAEGKPLFVNFTGVT